MCLLLELFSRKPKVAKLPLKMLEIKNEADGTSGQHNAELWGMAAKGSCLVSRGYKVLCSPKYSYYIDPTEDQSTLWFGGHMISWKGTYSEG